MVERLRASSLRTRLIAALVLTTMLVLAGTLVFLHARAAADLNDHVDERLQSDLREFQSSPAGRANSSAGLAVTGRRFIASQGYQADASVFAIALPSGSLITNEPELIEHGGGRGEQEDSGDQHSDESFAQGLVSAPDGFSTISGPDEAELRVLTAPVGPPGAPVGTVHVAESLSAVHEVEESLGKAIIAVGAIALLAVIAAAVFIAARLAAPLGRIERFAADVDDGRVEGRIDADTGPAEVRSLARSFNHMLDRVQRSFSRQREFVADASHELRTPLTVVSGEVAMLERDADPEQRERLEVIDRELQRMQRLVTEMLTLAGADDRTSLRLEEIDLDDFLEDLERELPMLGDRDYEVRRVPGSFVGDRDRITQVLRNLVGNAVAHTAADGRIRISAELPAPNVVRFEVADDGPGFPPGEAGRVFDRFYRTDQARGRERGGAGLGLAIAKAIVEAHGGRIRAGRAPEGGALLVFELPRSGTGIKAGPGRADLG